VADNDSAASTATHGRGARGARRDGIGMFCS